ncbi:MAG: hypothetical protein KGQ59_08645 [Bdellovibrionales bacterium]|nr:hypothetical protein [Bdellovibrionales bacterium]
MEIKKSYPQIHGDLGILHVPLALTLGIIATCSLSLLIMGSSWTRSVKAQLQLDRCTGKTALELRQRLETLEITNQEIKLLRTAAQAALIAGNLTVLETLKKSSTALASQQETQLLGWKKTQGQWWTQPECHKGKILLPLPEISYVRPPDDIFGPSPLHWKENQARFFSIALKRGGRLSESFVFPSKSSLETRWTASWRNPHAPL